MNKYLVTFFWVVTLVLFSFAIVHFVKVMKNKEKNNVDMTKSIVYISGAILLGLVLIYKPFDTSKMTIGLSKLLKAKPMSADTTAAIITTSLASPGVTV